MSTLFLSASGFLFALTGLVLGLTSGTVWLVVLAIITMIIDVFIAAFSVFNYEDKERMKDNSVFLEHTFMSILSPVIGVDTPRTVDTTAQFLMKGPQLLQSPAQHENGGSRA